MVARAIMHGPEVLFLDEPTTGLDPQSRLAVHDIITGLQAAGQTTCSSPTTWPRRTRSPTGLPSSTTAGCWPWTPRPGSSGSVHGGTAHARDGTGPAEFAAALAASVPGARDARLLGDAVLLTVDDGQPVLPAVLAAADACHARLARSASPPDPGDRLHPAHRQGATRLMTTATIPAPTARRSAAGAALAAFAALLARDLTVLRKQPADFLTRTIIQPVLFVFVLGYISPRIGQPAAGSAAQAATTLLAGMLAVVILFQGLFAVALPLVQDLGYTREIDDRLLAPLPARAVALEKIALGTIQGLLAALVIFPLAILIPAAPPALHIHWAVLLTLAPLAALMCASLGLFLGTAMDPRLTMALFAVLITPLMWLGCALFPWSALHVIPGSRAWPSPTPSPTPAKDSARGSPASLTSASWSSTPSLAAATGLLLWQATRHFTRRVIS